MALAVILRIKSFTGTTILALINRYFTVRLAGGVLVCLSGVLCGDFHFSE